MTICLLLGWIIWFRRSRRKRRTAPSAEFMSERVVYHPATSEPFTHRVRAAYIVTQESDTVTSRDSESEDPPPPFSPGLYSDHIFEKIQERDGHKRPLENDEDQESTVYGYESEDNGVAAESTGHSQSYLGHIGEAI